MATAIYMRVSTEKQEETGVSLHTQKERLQAYCTMKGFENVKEYLDVGSGRTTDKRMNFNIMMDDVENGFISNVVILKLDRLTRSIIDLNNLVKKLNDKECHLHSCTENIDTTTASGRMMINLIGTFAQWESETISERVKMNMQSLAEQGIWQSSVPYGFMIGEDRRLQIKEKEKEIINEAFDLVLKGDSFSRAQDKIMNKYNLDWNRGFLLRKLRMQSTIGNIYRVGKVFKNKHEPLIANDKYNKLLTIAKERSAPRKEVFTGDLFRQKIVCPQCFRMLSLRANRSDKDGRHLHSYKCDHCYRDGRKTINVSEIIMENALLRYLDKINLEIEKEDIDVNETETELIERHKELANLKNEKKRIQRAWIKGFMEEEELLEHQKEIDDNVTETIDRINELESTEVITEEEILSLQTTLKENYVHLTKQEKIDFIQMHIKEIRISRKLLKGYKKKYKVTIDSIAFY